MPSPLPRCSSDVHFLEEVAVSDDFELLEDQVDAALDEERLVRVERRVELEQVPAAHRRSDVSELHQVVLAQQLKLRHVTLKPKVYDIHHSLTRSNCTSFMLYLYKQTYVYVCTVYVQRAVLTHRITTY